MKTNTIKVKVSALVEDFDLYPRVSVDSGHVAHIAEAIEAEMELPLIIVEVKTLRIVDGFHRARAYKRVFGKDHLIEVETREYASESDLFLEAMRLNAAHGRNMTSYDRAHAISRAEKFEIDPALVASALNMRRDRIDEFQQQRFCRVKGKRNGVPTKLPIRHMVGKVLTREQAEAIPSLGGNQQGFYVNQLIILIETDMLDTDNERLMERLKVLQGKLDEVLLQKH